MDHFLCTDSSCKSPLELIAVTDNCDSGACGDGYRYEYYRCLSCGALYSRLNADLGSWEAFSFEKHQKYIKKCSKMPKCVELL